MIIDGVEKWEWSDVNDASDSRDLRGELSWETVSRGRGAEDGGGFGVYVWVKISR